MKYETLRSVAGMLRPVALLGWSATTFATELAPPDLVALPWASIAVATIISIWGGMAATLGRIARAEEKIYLPVIIAKDVLVSTIIGVIVYSLGAWREWNVWELAIVLLLAGYGGSRVLDMLLDRWVVGARVESRF